MDICDEIAAEIGAMVEKDAEVVSPGGPPEVAAAVSPGGLSGVAAAGDDWLAVGQVEVRATRHSGSKYEVVVRRKEDGKNLAVDIIDLASKGGRAKVIAETLEALGLSEHDEAALEAGLAQALKDLAVAKPATQGAGGLEFFAVTHDLKAEGLYRRVGKPPARLTNFVMRITEHLTLLDEGGPQTRFRGTISRGGDEREFDVAARDYAGNERLKAAIFEAGPPGVDIIGDIDLVRRAITRVSQPTSRTGTADVGWTDDRKRFLVPGGHVDEGGYHDFDPGAGVLQVDLSACEGAKNIGLSRLDAHELGSVQRHVVEELMCLHDRRVMRCILGAVALAPLKPFLDSTAPPVIWLRGLTGTGKSLVAWLALNFFGDFPPYVGNHIASWSATPNFIQVCGYYHRHCLYFVDDFKFDATRHTDVVRVLQNYSEGTGRGRLTADSSMKVTRPIRGLLLSTGEDFPMQNASGLGRSIVVEVPTRDRDLALRARCYEMRPLYRGMMASFLRGVIVEGRGAKFRDRVSYWEAHLLAKIAGKTNDARLASTHAQLAAAFEQMASFLSEAWPGWHDEVLSFVDEDLAEMVGEAAYAVEDERPADIFLRALGELLTTRRVGIGLADGKGDSDGKARLIGFVDDGAIKGLDEVGDATIIRLVAGEALGEVQESLRRQQRPSIPATERTLIAQMAEQGLLVDAAGKPIPKDHKGSKSRQERIGGTRMRVVRIRKVDLCGAIPLCGREDSPRPSYFKFAR